jgi:hypothetical protein
MVLIITHRQAVVDIVATALLAQHQSSLAADHLWLGPRITLAVQVVVIRLVPSATCYHRLGNLTSTWSVPLLISSRVKQMPVCPNVTII